jgi:hypothetical protein
MNLLTIAAIIFFLNIPFGYWRANKQKYSLQWLLAVHLPVPAMVAFRTLAGLGWELKTFPVLVGAFFLGQFVGGRVHSWLRGELKVPVTSCLVWDVVRSLRVEER